MVKNESGTYEPLKGYLETAVPHINLLHDDKYFQEHVAERAGKNTFVLPEMKDEMGDTKRVVYTIYEYDPLIDSSNMSYLEYRQLAADIFSVYEHFDGFVIVHGTDTMSYTASSLSFMMEELGKPVVLTGAQKPMAEMRTDAIDNLQGALVIAGTLIIPEVALYFNRRLFRGNRVMKTDAQDFHAFSSYNMEPLIKMGTEINCNWDLIWRSQKPTKFSISHGWNPNVALLRIFPSITATTVRSFLQPPIRGVVFQSYGAGNGPSNREDIIREIKVAIARGVFIVIISQCQTGIVSSAYAAGAAFAQAGCVLGADMTPEAALAKLSYVLGLEGLTATQRKELLETNIRGELTQADLTKFSLSNSTFLQSVADSMKASTEAEIHLIKASLFPCLMCSAAKEGNFQGIKKLKEDGGDYSMTDYDGRTPLHIAAAAGHELLVEEMLLDGCPVHKKDHTGCTPLTEAIKNKHFQIIEMLRNAGAVLKCSQQQTCNELMMNVVGNDLDAITAWHAGGADLDASNYDGRTALHIAVARGAEDIVRFLISQGCDPERKDNFGRTPMSEAAEQEEIIELLEWGLSMKDPPPNET